ncbi:MAG: Rpn family recombination-promoting nuclease/putative transposase [Acidobacteria bacterium]|nr:Rpn family recombination-promoting nuclease/putative transposase [Acidobacteriota bacterium]
MDVKNPHDAFFKQLMSRLEVARDFLQNYLPEKVIAALDVRSLELVDGSFVDEELKDHLSDLIFRVKLKRGGKAYIYILFEHKSSPDKWVAWQVLRYSIRVWEAEKQKRVKKFSPVIPIVFYHGAETWQVSLRFSDLLAFEGIEELRDYVPEFRYHLCDVSQYADDEIRGSALLRFGLLLLKYIFRAELAAKLTPIFEIYRPLWQGNRWEFLFTALKYLATGARKLKRESLQETLTTVFPEKEGEVAMSTLAETWMKEGLQEGLQQGLQQGRQQEAATFTLRLLRKRFQLDAKTEAQIRTLGVEQLEELGVASLDFTKPKEVLAWLRANHQ